MHDPVTVIAHRHRAGGGFRWSLDTEDQHLQLGPLLLSRCRQPAGAPLLDEAATTQAWDNGEMGWTVGWVGWCIAPLRLAVSVREHERLGRAVRRLQNWKRARARRRSARRNQWGDLVAAHGGYAADTDECPPDPLLDEDRLYDDEPAVLQPTDYEEAVRRAIGRDRAAVVRALEGEWGTLGSVLAMLDPLPWEHRAPVLQTALAHLERIALCGCRVCTEDRGETWTPASGAEDHPAQEPAS